MAASGRRVDPRSPGRQMVEMSVKLVRVPAVRLEEQIERVSDHQDRPAEPSRPTLAAIATSVRRGAPGL